LVFLLRSRGNQPRVASPEARTHVRSKKPRQHRYYRHQKEDRCLIQEREQREREREREREKVAT